MKEKLGVILPIEHPDFRYPASSHPYLKKLSDVQGRCFVNDETEQYAGKWLRQFTSGQTLSDATPTGPLIVEVGCNGGHVCLEWATQRPSTRYIGIDWKLKQIVLAAQKANKRNLSNILFLRAHGARLEYIFGPDEVDEIDLFFPDPWPKKSQKKNRMVQETWLRGAHRVLKPGGRLHVKTDHREYFDWMETQIGETADLWEIESLTRDLHHGNLHARELKIPDVTLFERIFVKDGLPIHSVKLIKKV